MRIAHRSHRGAGEHGADGPALVEDDAHQPGEKLGGAGTDDHEAACPLRERPRATGSRPEADQSAERPKVDEQNERVLFAGDGRDEKVLDDVELAADDPAERDPDEQRAYDFASGEREDDRDGGREDGPEAEMVSVLGESSGRRDAGDHQRRGDEQGDPTTLHRSSTQILTEPNPATSSRYSSASSGISKANVITNPVGGPETGNGMLMVPVAPGIRRAMPN